MALSFLLQKSDILQRKIRVRPDRSQLIRMHILEGRGILNDKDCHILMYIIKKIDVLDLDVIL